MNDLLAYSNDIEEEMVQATIEASKREAGKYIQMEQWEYLGCETNGARLDEATTEEF
ncbi:hypothetical protein U1Q18_044869 [Sarracenia purpurea var. burkii]